MIHFSNLNVVDLERSNGLPLPQVLQSDLRRTADSLKALGVWDRIGRVEVRDCDLLRHSDVVAMVGEQRLQYLDGYADSRKSCSKFV